MTLVVTDLSIEIGGRVVVDSLGFTVENGQRFGLIGESGSGKSLTALAILGLLPDGATVSGSVLLDGVELLGLPDRELAGIRGNRIGIVFQEPRTALNPLRRIGRQISEPLRIHEGLSRRDADARAIELAASVLLPEPERIVRLYPHQLSGGQRQRVAIAIALACSPAVLIADEPTTALDVTIQAEILALFDRLIERSGTALIFVTHDLAVLSQVSTEVVVLAHGKAVESGPVSRILAAPQHPVTIGLLEAARATSWDPQRPATATATEETAS
jgi:peptide/nickel transport system ATP-binding protein